MEKHDIKCIYVNVCGKIQKVKAVEMNRNRSKNCGCKRYAKLRIRMKGIDGQATFNKILDAYLRGAKNRNLSWNLTIDEFRQLISLPCYFCNSSSSMTTISRGDIALQHNGVDRLNNSIGYEKSNCVPCCKMCNRAKGKSTVEEFITWERNIAKHNGY